jgi:MFS family permease
LTHDVSTESKSRWLVLVVLCAGMLMIILDSTIVNVALPAIQSDLGFSQSGLAWVVNAYLIAHGGLPLLAGRLGDVVGRKHIRVIGLIAYGGLPASAAGGSLPDSCFRDWQVAPGPPSRCRRDR